MTTKLPLTPHITQRTIDSRTKHIDRRHYFIRELVEDGKIVVPFVSSADNLAYFFTTKPLPPAKFFALREKIMNVYRET